MADRAWHDTMKLADRYVVTLYDAAYPELSLHRGLPQATFDAALRRVASLRGRGCCDEVPAGPAIRDLKRGFRAAFGALAATGIPCYQPDDDPV
jgi:hypothetical protein